MMLSKLLRCTAPVFGPKWVQPGGISSAVCRIPVPMKPLIVPTRGMSNLIPPSQYDMPWSKRLNILYVVRVYWETIPLFFTNFCAIATVMCAIAWACNNKVDIVFHTHSRQNISRTMDLRNPSIHKIRIINQRYPPWPEMQDSLDKMKEAERRALMRAQTCATP